MSGEVDSILNRERNLRSTFILPNRKQNEIPSMMSSDDNISRVLNEKQNISLNSVIDENPALCKYRDSSDKGISIFNRKRNVRSIFRLPDRKENVKFIEL